MHGLHNPKYKQTQRQVIFDISFVLRKIKDIRLVKCWGLIQRLHMYR